MKATLFLTLFWGRERLAAIVRALYVAGLVHPKRKLSSVAIAGRFSAGVIALAVFCDRNSEAIADDFRVANIIRHQTSLYQRRKIAECAFICQGVSGLDRHQTFEQVLDI